MSFRGWGQLGIRFKTSRRRCRRPRDCLHLVFRPFPEWHTRFELTSDFYLASRGRGEKAGENEISGSNQLDVTEAALMDIRNRDKLVCYIIKLRCVRNSIAVNDRNDPLSLTCLPFIKAIKAGLTFARNEYHHKLIMFV